MREKLLACALLAFCGLADEENYRRQLDACFLRDPEDENLLYLEWEPDIQKAAVHIRTHMTGARFDREEFGRLLMDRLWEIYESGPDIRKFARKMYELWTILPENLRDREPFFSFCYADEPLDYGDEGQTRAILERALSFYGPG